jgi:histone-binding protein RBBP4
MTQPIHRLTWHKDHITQTKFSPLQPNLLATSAGDCLVCIWDLSKIGEAPTESDLRDGTPPELLFVHGGHQAKISDFSWNLNEKLTLGSVSEDNVLQVWTVAHDLY